MPNLTALSRRIALSAVALVFPLFITITPLAGGLASADDCVAPASTTPGVHTPVGSDSVTYTYQCDGDYAGKWTNPYYVYDPATGATAPLFDPEYQYDCQAGTWSMVTWSYAPGDGQFHQSRVTASRPGAATDCPVPEPAVTPAAQNGSSGGGTDNSSGSGSGTGTAAALAGVTTSGPGSTSSTNLNGTTNTNLNNQTTASMNNTITGVATTGNSLVLANTTAGSATTGNAQDIANIVNMLQSSSNALGSSGNTIVFTKNINGDVNGDLLLDPAQLGAVQNASSATNIANNLKVNNSTDASINNTVTLAAASGDATVSQNTNAGDARTGNAQAIANIVNTINSALTAGHSFIGTININGNLNGDILLPDNFVDQLLAANVPTVTITAPSSTNTAMTDVNNTTTVTNTNNLGITNNITSTATTGNANVSNNTNGGNATTGNGTTSITAFNLTGSKVIGANDLLVFVNAPGGKWVGVIVSAPAGTTAASLGGGITSSGPNSTNSSTVNASNDTNIDNTTNEHINNDVNVSATSGDATVASNTTAGDATTGNADTRVNLANIENSTLSLSGWLGILFINVFGTWHGSFGVNTSAGDPLPVAVGISGVATTQDGRRVPIPAQVFRFVPHSTKASTGSGSTGSSGSPLYTASTLNSNGSAGNGSASSDSSSDAVLAASTIKSASGAPAPSLSGHKSHTARTLAIAAACFLFYVAWDASARRREHWKARS